MSTESPAVDVEEDALKKLADVKIVDDENKDKGKTSRSPRGPRVSDEERRRQWEEKQSQKPVLETSIKGKVKWYSVRNHYGFIAREDGQKDVFVHQSAIAKSRIIRFFLRTLAEDEEVLFDVVNGDKGPEAANVTGPDGSEVKGAKHFRILLRPFRNRNSKKSVEEKEDAGGDVKPAKEGGQKKKRRQGRRRTSTAKSEKAGEEKEAKPARRRSARDQEKEPADAQKDQEETKTLLPSDDNPKEAGDASLGANVAPTAAVH